MLHSNLVFMKVELYDFVHKLFYIDLHILDLHLHIFSLFLEEKFLRLVPKCLMCYSLHYI